MATFSSLDAIVAHLGPARRYPQPGGTHPDVGGRNIPVAGEVSPATGALLPPRQIVGITGAPGAGKSTLAEELQRRIPSSALLPMDGYHLPQARLVELGRRDRMGAPDTFDVDAFVTMLEAVRFSGGPVTAAGFDREIEEPVPDAITIPPEKRTVIVEGNYLLLDSGGWERVAPLLDVALFVRVPESVRHERLIARHIRFGKSPGDARAWTLGPDEANARLIGATAARADHEVALS